MATQLAEKQNNPVEVVRNQMGNLAPELKAALPAHVTVEKFSRVAMTAIQNTPDLLQADRRSLFGAVVRLAQDGLLPDGREAALVIFNTKSGNEWIKKVQAMPMIAGVLKKIRQSGEVAKISAQCVYEADEFEVRYGYEEDVHHVPPRLGQPRGEIIGAYATAVLKDGTKLLEVMDLDQIEKVRSVSRSGQKGPWADWFSEMARKTVMRRLSKRLPMSTDVEDFILRDETMAAEFKPVEETKPLSSEMLIEQAAPVDTEADEPEDEAVEEAEVEEAAAEETKTGPDTSKVRRMIAAADTKADLKAADEEFVKLRASLSDDEAEEIDGLIADQRKKVS